MINGTTGIKLKNHIALKAKGILAV